MIHAILHLLIRSPERPRLTSAPIFFFFLSLSLPSPFYLPTFSSHSCLFRLFTCLHLRRYVSRSLLSASFLVFVSLIPSLCNLAFTTANFFLYTFFLLLYFYHNVSLAFTFCGALWSPFVRISLLAIFMLWRYINPSEGCCNVAMKRRRRCLCFVYTFSLQLISYKH